MYDKDAVLNHGIETERDNKIDPLMDTQCCTMCQSKGQTKQHWGIDVLHLQDT